MYKRKASISYLFIKSLHDVSLWRQMRCVVFWWVCGPGVSISVVWQVAALTKKKVWHDAQLVWYDTFWKFSHYIGLASKITCMCVCVFKSTIFSWMHAEKWELMLQKYKTEACRAQSLWLKLSGCWCRLVLQPLEGAAPRPAEMLLPLF